jgi:hypothetical protein
MISNMKRVAGLVTLLGLALNASSRPAFAQDGASNGWFDSAPGDADESTPPPPPDAAPEAPPGEPPADESEPADSQEPTSPPPIQGGESGSQMAPQQGPAQGPEASPPQGPPNDVPETDPSAMTEFRPTLDPYGTWLDDPKFGTVWVPNREAVGDDFAPYVSAGHWALTDDNDWVWQSDYPFGGVVFHYGRWVWIPGTGWAWIAGRRYANAWVKWRVPIDDYGYVGWAPMPPAWGWYNGAAMTLWWAPPPAYVFCPSGYAFSPHVNSYIVRDRYVVHDVAAHTRNYSEGRGGSVHLAASPRGVLLANSVAPRGPSLQTAHVPPSMAPVSRLSFAGIRPGGSPAFRSSEVHSRANTPSAYRGSRSWPATGYRPSAYGNAGSMQRPIQYSAPRSANYRAEPQRIWEPSEPSAPRYYSQPAANDAAPVEHYSAPAANYSAPVEHYSAPVARYSAPVEHYSAPVVHYNSAPTMHYSAPSFHSAPSQSFHSSSRR